MTVLEQLLRQQKTAAERQKLREAEETVCGLVFDVGGSRAASVLVGDKHINLLVTDEYECVLEIQVNGVGVEGDARRDVLFALVREVGS